MARRIVITDHALDRFAERHPEFDELTPGKRRQVFLAELERGVPFGGQLGDDELSLLPSGLVAVIVWSDGVGFVKTVLTRSLAMANMQAQGLLPDAGRRRRRPVAVDLPRLGGEADPPAPAPPAPEPPAPDPLLEAQMRQLAELHLSEGLGRRQRNARLRELGYDTSGPAGEVYRAVFHAAREAERAAEREQAPRIPRPGLTGTQLTDFATRYTAAWCSHEPERVAEFFAEDGSLTINRGAPAIGRAAIAAAAEGFMTAFPDLIVVMNSLNVGRPTVYYHWTLTGTNTGPGGTGRAVRISGYEEWTFGPDGRIARSLGYFDEAAYRAQLQGIAESR
jgi:uncharacterized protein (TIGR02246 family)